MTPRTSHRSHGAYRLLERPRAYDGLQRLLGASDARQRFVREFVQPCAGARVLDIGCGPAALLDDLPRDVEYTGFDMNPAYIEAAQRRHGNRGRFFCARVGEEGGALPDAQFDVAIARGILHHLDDRGADRLLSSACRLLKPGGVLVSCDGVYTDRLPLVARLLLSLDRGGHVRTADGYRQLFAPHFTRLDAWIVDDLSRVPYRHFIARARRTA